MCGVRDLLRIGLSFSSISLMQPYKAVFSAADADKVLLNNYTYSEDLYGFACYSSTIYCFSPLFYVLQTKQSILTERKRFKKP